MKVTIYKVDAFTDKVFSGNYAAVCILNKWLDDDIMQSIAAENNLPETAFIIKMDNYFDIRWFTPVLEIDLAGHPTLAAAHVIFNHLNYKKDIINFKSKSGDLSVEKKDNIYYLNFPSRKPKPVNIPPFLIEGLGKKPLKVLKSRDLLVLYESENDIKSISPDFKTLEKVDTFGIIVTSKGDNSDFVSRFFAPRAGINEDPVTGSAHCTLIPFWSEKLNKDSLHAFQISKRRGELFCKNLNDRVEIGGKAVTFLIGEIFI